MSAREPQDLGRLGRYRLLRKLAQGGMAEVYLAEAEGAAGFQKTLVVKRLLPALADDPTSREMFLNEARLAARLNHPNVVSIHDLGEEGGQYFIAMEYIDGASLCGLGRRFREEERPIPQWHAARIASLACEGLQYAHEALGADGQPMELVHRDISPDNILVSNQGAVKLVDFGIAKVADQAAVTMPGFARGKLLYMSPEQLRADRLDRRSDVFSLAGVLYELLAGTPPFARPTKEATASAILNEAPVSLRMIRPDLDPDLVASIERALMKDRGRRTPSAAAFQLELEAAMSQHGAAPTTQEISLLLVTVSEGLHARTEVTPESEVVTASGRPRARAAQGEPSTEPVLPPERHQPESTRPDRGAATAVGPAPTVATPVRGPLRGWHFGLLGVSLAGTVAFGLYHLRSSAGPGESSSPPEASPPSGVPAEMGKPAGLPPRLTDGAPAVTAALPQRPASAARHETGMLSLRAYPWARVVIDGVFKGVTPMEPLRLPVGRHHLVLTNSQLHATKERSVLIREGATETLKVSMVDPD